MPSSNNQTQHNLIKFSLLVLVLAAYAGFIILKYGVKEGILMTALTWSFFVLCTPIADAGFLLDFPVRLIIKMKMLHSEIIVWIIAICLNLFALKFSPEVYQQSMILKFFNHILLEPIPYWGIIIVSCIGTFLSVYFGDEIIDNFDHTTHHKIQKRNNLLWYIALTAFIGITLILYKFLLTELGVELPL